MKAARSMIAVSVRACLDLIPDMLQPLVY